LEELQLFRALATNGKIIVAGGDGANGTNLAYSVDGENWTTVNMTNKIGGSIYSIAYANNMWVAGGGNGSSNKMAYSVDGRTWTATTTPHDGTSVAYIKSISYGNGKWLAGLVNTPANGSVILTSSDGGVTPWNYPDC
jgi:hypothetical protein